MKVAELRKSILQAAVEGKLISQNPNDEPASELLKRIKQEKERLIRDGKIKKEKPLPTINEDEIPYDLPKGWTWCRLGELGETNIGLTYKPTDISEVGTAIMRSSNIQNGRMDYDDIVYVKIPVPDKSMLQMGDVLICARNGSRNLVGKTAIVDKEGLAFGAFMAMFRSECNPYINAYFASPLFRENMDNPQTTTINQITQEMLKNTLFPLPPFDEQRRIVAKANELIGLCDEFESAQKELNLLESQFAEYLPKSILQAAVQGKLVAQDPNDEPATELLKRIKQEKNELVRDGKIKKEKTLPPISEDEIPYDLPTGWVWCRLGELGETNIGLTYKPTDIAQTGTPVMRSGNIQNGKMDYADVVFVKSEVPHKAMLQVGDILICARNGSRSLVGKSAIVDKNDLAFGAFMAMFRSICNPYINAYLSSPLFRANMDNPQTTTVNQITQDMLKNTLLPLPPLAEQQRIVSKADELMLLCDELKAAHTLPPSQKMPSIIPFIQKTVASVVSDKDMNIRIAARGNAKGGLAGQAVLDADELLGDD